MKNIFIFIRILSLSRNRQIEVHKYRDFYGISLKRGDIFGMQIDTLLFLDRRNPKTIFIIMEYSSVAHALMCHAMRVWVRKSMYVEPDSTLCVVQKPSQQHLTS